MNEIETMPVQTSDTPYKVPKVVSLRAYEAYSAIFGPQEALVTGHCRGGFGIGEMIAFLYARSFPQNEWRARFDEAITGMSRGKDYDGS